MELVIVLLGFLILLGIAACQIVILRRPEPQPADFAPLFARLDAMERSHREDLVALRKEVREELERIRHTVDEKLQSTLERRLSDAFQRVSERLEQVYRGLGEMRSLALEVGDVKRALTNVKTRGTWGEVQAGALL